MLHEERATQTGFRPGEELVCRSPVQFVNPYEVGWWQEKIVWDVINEVFDSRLDCVSTENRPSQDVKEAVTWSNGNDSVVVKWYKANTHPIHVGSISKPEFGIVVNGDQIANIESKNWHTLYKPLSIFQVDKQVISRFRYIWAPQNILIISELRLEKCDHDEILNLLDEYHVTVLLTHRKAIESTDIESYKTIWTKLQPILLQILAAETAQNRACEPDWFYP
jgi:hypothetical protein